MILFGLYKAGAIIERDFLDLRWETKLFLCWSRSGIKWAELEGIIEEEKLVIGWSVYSGFKENLEVVLLRNLGVLNDLVKFSFLIFMFSDD